MSVRTEPGRSYLRRLTRISELLEPHVSVRPVESESWRNKEELKEMRTLPFESRKLDRMDESLRCGGRFGKTKSRTTE